MVNKVCTGEERNQANTQKKSEKNIVKSIRNLFKLKKENERIKDRITKDMILFEQKDDYHKPIRVGNCWNNNYVEYKSNGDRTKNLSVKEYLKKIEPHLRDIIIYLQKSGTWKAQLTIVTNFIFSEELDEERVTH